MKAIDQGGHQDSGEGSHDSKSPSRHTGNTFVVKQKDGRERVYGSVAEAFKLGEVPHRYGSVGMNEWPKVIVRDGVGNEFGPVLRP